MVMFRKFEISSYRLPIALLVMAIFSQYPPSAYADIIKVSFSGTVLDSSGYSFTGDGDLTNGTVGTGFFGEQASGGTFDNPNVADINGALISGEYIIDTTLAPDNTSGFEFLGDYRSRRDVNDWMMASAIINGVAVDTFRPQIFNDSSSSLQFTDAIHDPQVFAGGSRARHGTTRHRDIIPRMEGRAGDLRTRLRGRPLSCVPARGF